MTIKIATLGLFLASCAALSACATGPVDPISLQRSVADSLGLASSDEVSLANINKGPVNGLGGSVIKFDATTARGRHFHCSAVEVPQINPLQTPSLANTKCWPV